MSDWSDSVDLGITCFRGIIRLNPWPHDQIFCEWCFLKVTSAALCICLFLQKQLSENVYTDERRALLLCGGRICLRVVQELFGLTVIEMMHGPMWIVLVSDADGFVPLTFTHKDELTIRSARRKSPIRAPSCTDVFPPESPLSPSAEKWSLYHLKRNS